MTSVLKILTKTTWCDPAQNCNSKKALLLESPNQRASDCVAVQLMIGRRWRLMFVYLIIETYNS